MRYSPSYVLHSTFDILDWCRTVFFLIPAITIYTILLGTASIASSLIGDSGRFGHRCARWWSWLILVTTGVEVSASGLERVTPGQSYLFAANHQSIYDIPILFWHLPFDLRIVAKESLGRFPVLGWHLARTGHILVDRRNPGGGVFKRLKRLLTEHQSLLVFPEGTRSVDGRVGRFRGGIFLLAIEAQLPIVPVSVRRSRFVMRKGQLTTRPGFVTLEVGDPISVAGMDRSDAKALAARVQQVVSQMVASGEEPERVTVAQSFSP